MIIEKIIYIADLIEEDRDFPGVEELRDLVYNKELDKYTNIEPYLKWKKKGKDELTEEDIQFISSLPKPIEYLGKKYNLHLGKYGIYLKDNKNNNHKLDKKLWNNYY